MALSFTEGRRRCNRLSLAALERFEERTMITESLGMFTTESHTGRDQPC